jgi:hypothetical protein
MDLYARGVTLHPNNTEGGTELIENGKLDGATSHFPSTCRVKTERRWAWNPNTFCAKNRGGYLKLVQTEALQKYTL